MTREQQPESDALRQFLRKVWAEDVVPQLKGERREKQAQRQKSARVAGKAAAAGGLFVDTLFGLKGKPFTRALSVMGSSLGAMLPDAWDWGWLRNAASDEQRRVVSEQVRRRAQELPQRAALRMFHLEPTASRDELKQAWRRVTQRWHPDKAPDDRARREYHVRFVTYQAAYEMLSRAYDAGRLPVSEPADTRNDT